MALPLIIAHRGASALEPPGNTLAAFRRAIELGADMSELDVRRTRDGVLVVHHDAAIGGMAIGTSTWAEVNERARSRGYEVPNLVQVAELAAGRMALAVELKETGYEPEVMALLASYLAPTEVVVQSFLDEAVVAAKHADPRVRTGLLVGHRAVNKGMLSRVSDWLPEPRLLRTGADFVSPHVSLLRLRFLWRMHRLGLPALVWTVDDEPTLRRLMTSGVDGIITDRPELALRLRAESTGGGATLARERA